MGSKLDRLELVALSGDLGINEADIDLIVGFSAAYADEEWVALGRLERAPGKKDNWVEAVGTLPAYIEEIAHSLHTKRGMPISRAIATAVSRVKRWAAGGENVKADTRAKAAKALAAWEALKAKAAAKRATK